MHWETSHIAATGVSLAPIVRVADIDAYAAADAAKTKQVGVAIGTLDDRAPDFAVAAGREALARAKTPPHRVSSLIHHYAIHPGVDVANMAAYVARGLDIPAGPAAIHQTTGGCHAGVTGAELACALLGSFPHYETVLVTGADVAPAPIMDRFEPGGEIPHADGGSAVAIAREGRYRIVSTDTRSDVSLEAMHRGDEPFGPGRVGPDHPIRMVDRIHHFRAAIHREDLIARVRAVVVRSVEVALADAGVSLDSVDHVVLPFVGAHIRRRTYMEWLPFRGDQVRSAAERAQAVGHLTTSDPFAALDSLIQSDELRPGQRALIIADGSGFICSSMLVQALD